MKAINLEDILGKVKAVEETKLENEKGGYKGDERVLTLKKKCTYTVRLLPNIKDIDNTFVTYKEVGFNSRIDNSFVYGGRSPSDAGLKEDAFKNAQWKHYKDAKDAGDEAEQKVSYKLIPQRKQLVNAYLINVEGDDPEAKEKIGKVVVLRYPAQIDKTGAPISDIFKRIHSGVFGDMSKKIGSKAFDLSSKGKSLLIKVTEKAGYNNYSETQFDDMEDLSLTEEAITGILVNTHDLKEFVPEVKSKEEIEDLLAKHWYGDSASVDDEMEVEPSPVITTKPTKEKPSALSKKTQRVEDDDEIPMGDDSSSDDELDDLIKDL
jgi:hypothetical protein